MNYEKFFKKKLSGLKDEGRYRFFADLERQVGHFPIASNYFENDIRNVTVWCSNDYLGQGQNPIVLKAMHDAIDHPTLIVSFCICTYDHADVVDKDD